MNRIAIALLLALGAISAASETDQRAALREAAPPWYDAERDDWRRLDIPEDKPVTETNRSDGIRIPIPVDLVAWLLFLVVLAGAGWLAWRIWRDQAGSTTAEPDESTARAPHRALTNLRDLPFPVQDHTDAEAALAAALAEQNWDRAVVWLYGRLLLRLDRSGVVRLAKGTTNRQYLRSVATWCQDAPTRTSVHAALATSVSAFEATYFGHRPANADMVNAIMRAQDEALPQLTPGARP